MTQNTASLRVVSELRAQIHDGRIKPGQRVPSARQITKQFGVALATAAKALAQLKRERLVRVLPGVGTVVRASADGAAPELTRARVVEAAIAIADDEGTAALSMRSVARELGVATMSIYRHVTSKEQLLLLMADAVFAEAQPPRRPPRGWRARLHALGQMQWAAYRRHPWVAALVSMTRPQRMPNAMLHTEEVLQALDGQGLSPARHLQLAIALVGLVRGMATSLEGERDAERDTGLSPPEWLATQEAAFAPLMGRFPVLARLSAGDDVEMGLDALFETGLDCFLDGVAAELARTTRVRR